MKRSPFSPRPTSACPKIAALVLWALTSACVGGRGDAKTGASAAEDARRGSSSVANGLRLLLEAAGPGAQAAGAIVRLADVYRAFGEFEAATTALSPTRALVQKALNKLRTKGRLPMKLAELESFGIDPGGLVGFIGFRDDREVYLLPINAPKRFMAKLSPNQAWQATQQADAAYWRSPAQGPGRSMVCRFASGYAWCAKTQQALPGARATTVPHSLSGERPATLWQSVGPELRAELAGASAFFLAHGKKGMGHLRLNLTADGATLEGHISGQVVSKLAAHFPPGAAAYAPRQSPLAAYLPGSSSRALLNLPVEAFLQKNKVAPAQATLLGLDNFTGEVVAIERPAGELAAVVGARDPGTTERTVRFAFAALQAYLGAQARSSGGKKRFTLQPTQVEGRAAFTLEIAPGVMPLPVTLVVAAGPDGIYVGAKKLVRQLVSGASGSGAKAPPEAALAKGTIGHLTLALGDPLAALEGQAGLNTLREKLAKLPKTAQEPLQVTRCVMDLLHDISLTMKADGADGFALSARLRTRHRTNVAQDAAARTLWYRALEAKYAENWEGYRQALAELAQSYPQTRYGASAKASTATSLAIVGVLAAVAIPAFLKYIRRAKAAKHAEEARQQRLHTPYSTPDAPGHR